MYEVGVFMNSKRCDEYNFNSLTILPIIGIEIIAMLSQDGLKLRLSQGLFEG